MLTRIGYFLGIVLLPFCALYGRADAAIVVVDLTPAADTTIFQENPSNASGQGEFAFVGSTAGGVARRALMRFDLDAIAPGSTVLSATLAIVVNRVPPGAQDGTTAVHRLQADWGEGASDGGGGGSGAAAASGDATWSHRFFNSDATWTIPGGDFATTATAFTLRDSSGVATWSGSGLAADVQAWIDDPSTNFGWILVGNEELEKSAQRFFASETAAVDVRPTLRLEVMPIPEPSTYALIGLGLGMIGFSLKRPARKGRRG